MNYTSEMDEEYFNQTWTEEEFDDNIELIDNPFDSNASLGGKMFETYGKELEFVMNQKDPLTIWTYQEDDYGNTCFTSGFHLVNRIGYMIATTPLEEGMTIYVELEQPEEGQ